MKDIQKNSRFPNFQDYLTYLEGIKNKLSKHLYDFATNIQHYDLDSSSSLHDAWVEQIKIHELSDGDRNQNRSTELEIKFLGPQHDRFITLIYTGVLMVNLVSKDQLDIGWGDLLTHNISYDSKLSCIVHELSLANGNIKIFFQDMKHSSQRR